MLDLKTITADDFEKYIGKDYLIPDASGGHLPVTLVEVVRRPAVGAPPHCRQEQFSLSFRAPKGMEGPQGTYTLRSPAGEELALFLVPTGPESNAPRMSPDDHMIFHCAFN